jgi:hypothetical protein
MTRMAPKRECFASLEGRRWSPRRHRTTLRRQKYHKKKHKKGKKGKKGKHNKRKR